MNPRHRGGGEGARGPVDLGFAPTGAERRPNPPLATIKKTPENTMFRGFFICFIQLKSLPKYALLVNSFSD